MLPYNHNIPTYSQKVVLPSSSVITGKDYVPGRLILTLGYLHYIRAVTPAPHRTAGHGTHS